MNTFICRHVSDGWIVVYRDRPTRKAMYQVYKNEFMALRVAIDLTENSKLKKATS